MRPTRPRACALAFAAFGALAACGESFQTGDGATSSASTSAATSGVGGASASSAATGPGGGPNATAAATTGAGGEGGCTGASCVTCTDPFLAALHDDFADGATAAVWTPFADTGAVVEEKLGELRIGTAIGFMPPKFAGYYTSSIAVFDECAVSVRLLSPAGIGDAPGYLTYFRLRSSSVDSFVSFTVHDGTLSYELVENGMPTDESGDVYASDLHKYLRFREEGGILSWEISPDGVRWDERKKVTTPVFVASSRVHLAAGVIEDLQVPSVARFDDVNILPP